MAEAAATPAGPITLRGGGDELCVAYANTRAWRGRAVPDESLPDLAALLNWLGSVAHVPAPPLRQAAALARQHPHRTERLFTDAIVLREALYRGLFALSAGQACAPDDLEQLNAALAATPQRRHLTARPAAYAWVIPPPAMAMPSLLAPVLWSAADLLARAELVKLRHCANPECRWLFIDHSKNGTRRWCDMASCGNRAKAQRHYRRQRDG